MNEEKKAGPQRIEKPNLLLVEGKDDLHFFKIIAEKMGFKNSIQLKELGSKYKFKTEIKAVVLAPGFEKVKRMGIVRDADRDGDPFASVRDAIKEAGLTAPEKELQLSNGRPQLIVYILPGDGKQGSLEDLCIESIEDKGLLNCIDKYFQCLENNCNKADVPPESRKSKAKLHTYLASRPEPGRPIGLAVQMNYIDYNSPAFNDVREFIEMLTHG